MRCRTDPCRHRTITALACICRDREAPLRRPMSFRNARSRARSSQRVLVAAQHQIRRTPPCKPHHARHASPARNTGCTRNATLRPIAAQQQRVHVLAMVGTARPHCATGPPAPCCSAIRSEGLGKAARPCRCHRPVCANIRSCAASGPHRELMSSGAARTIDEVVAVRLRPRSQHHLSQIVPWVVAQVWCCTQRFAAAALPLPSAPACGKRRRSPEARTLPMRRAGPHIYAPSAASGDFRDDGSAGLVMAEDEGAKASERVAPASRRTARARIVAVAWKRPTVHRCGAGPTMPHCVAPSGAPR